MIETEQYADVAEEVVQVIEDRAGAGLTSSRDDVIAGILARYPEVADDELTEFAAREVVGRIFDRVARERR
jgi:hypothetical protein